MGQKWVEEGGGGVRMPGSSALEALLCLALRILPPLPRHNGAG